MLFTGFKNVFQRAAVLGSASASKQFDRHRGSRQQKGDQDCSEVGHGAIVSPDWRLDVPNFLHEIAKSDRRVLESMSKVVDLRNRPSPSLVFALID
jgi:hypothetical protein